LQCDRDEGDSVQRFNAAARSYFEWLPIRHHPGSMGVVEIGSLNQIIKWGDMATIVAVDTRISYRSKEPTLQQFPLYDFLRVILLHRDVREYANPSSQAYKAIMRVAKKSKGKQNDPKLTMIGKNIEIIRSAFADSKTNGQPWQIWAASTAFSRPILGDFFNLDRFISDASLAGKVMEENLKLHNARSAIVPRAVYASTISRTPWNSDDFSGFAHEQKSILQMFKENASNPIVLSGDLHDSYGWQIFENGKFNGTPAAVNLITPAVTCPVG
jgi:phosphodiesterase/alkaline phosphatase D-like protein